MTFIHPEATIPGIKEWMEEEYLRWCGQNDLDPDLGGSARAYEESKTNGYTVEEWWEVMEEEYQWQQKRER